MASIKIVLDKRRPKADGKYPLIIRITQNSKTRAIPLKISLTRKDWDEKRQIVKKAHENHALLNHIIRKKYLEIETKILKIEDNATRFSIGAIRNKITDISKQTAVFEFVEGLIKQMKQANKLGNALVYQSTINKLSKFHPSRALEFTDITYDFIMSYETFLISKGLMGNTISIYLRTLRIIYNKAIKSGVAERANYPFYGIPIKHEKTRKRAISKERIKMIENLELPVDTAIWNARNYFILSFNLIGISFMDLVTLKKSDIKNGRITYVRRKTGKHYDIKLTVLAKSIINYYQNKIDSTDENAFILPVIPNQFNGNLQQEHKYVKMGAKLCNKYLGKIASKCNIDEHLTNYVQRHSWATIAKKMGYSIDMIAESLGHEIGNKVTSIYLDKFDQEILDEMNEKVTA